MMVLVICLTGFKVILILCVLAGFYSTKLNLTGMYGTPNMRLIAINSNLYNSQNDLTGSDEDPGGQFAWMEQQLTEARGNQEKV